MTKYISGELKQRLQAVVAEFTGAHTVDDDAEPIAVSAYVTNPGEYTQKLPVGERTELLRLAATPAPVSPPALAEEFTTAGLMQQGGDLPDPPLFLEVLGKIPPEVNPWRADVPAVDVPGSALEAFDAECRELLAGFAHDAARLFADSDARWPIRRLRQVTSS